MKKTLIALFLIVIGFTACADDTVITANQLPKAAQAFIADHFPGCQVTYAEKDSDSYEVKLSNGWEIDFGRKGNWKEIDCKDASVPATVLALLPPSISLYVSTNYPDVSVVEISKGRKYDVELSNGLDLEFDLKGNFLRIDN